MPTVAFAFGSFGDITSILQLAWAIRRALSDAVGASAQIRTLVADLDSFTRALQHIKATLMANNSSVSSSDALLNGIAHALNKCFAILQALQARIDTHRTRIAQAKGLAVWRAYWALSAWEILGGRDDVEAMKARLLEQLSVIQVLFSASQSQKRARIVEDVRELGDAVQTLRSGLVKRLSTTTSPFVFFDRHGAQRLPLATLRYQDFLRAFDFDQVEGRITGNTYATVLFEYNAAYGSVYFTTLHSQTHLVLGNYHLPLWLPRGTVRAAFGCFVHITHDRDNIINDTIIDDKISNAYHDDGRDGRDGTVYISDIWMAPPVDSLYHTPSVLSGDCMIKWAVMPSLSARMTRLFIGAAASNSASTGLDARHVVQECALALRFARAPELKKRSASPDVWTRHCMTSTYSP